MLKLMLRNFFSNLKNSSFEIEKPTTITNKNKENKD